MQPVSPTKGTEKTLTTLNLYLRVAEMLNLMNGLSQQQKIDLLHATRMEVSNPKHLNANERNVEFLKQLKEKDHATRLY